MLIASRNPRKVRLEFNPSKFSTDLSSWLFRVAIFLTIFVEVLWTVHFQRPKTAGFFLSLFLPKVYREAVLGDLTEQYPMVRSKRGELATRLWLYRQIFASIWPLITQAVNKLARRFTK